MQFKVKESDSREQEVVVAAGDLERVLPVPGLARMFRLLFQPRRKSDTCPACGWTRSQFTETGLLGCGLCYEIFQVESPSQNV